MKQRVIHDVERSYIKVWIPSTVVGWCTCGTSGWMKDQFNPGGRPSVSILMPLPWTEGDFEDFNLEMLKYLNEMQ